MNLGNSDKWAKWIHEDRFAKNDEFAQRLTNVATRIRDQILVAASIQLEDHVLDVATGNGLLGLGALKYLNKNGRVYLTDISLENLKSCAKTIQELQEESRVSLHQIDCEELDEGEGDSIDVILSRGILPYLVDKEKYFLDCYNILRSGGRLSGHEPLNSFVLKNKPKYNLYGFDLSLIKKVADKIIQKNIEVQGNLRDLMLDYTEHSLFSNLINVGFSSVQINLQSSYSHLTIFPDVQSVLKYVPNPNAWSLERIAETVLSNEEKDTLVKHIKGLLANGQVRKYNASIFYAAYKK